MNFSTYLGTYTGLHLSTREGEVAAKHISYSWLHRQRVY